MAIACKKRAGKTVRKMGRPATLNLRPNAKALGISISHLFRVLRKERVSKSLMRRYRALKVAKKLR